MKKTFLSLILWTLAALLLGCGANGTPSPKESGDTAADAGPDEVTLPEEDSTISPPSPFSTLERGVGYTAKPTLQFRFRSADPDFWAIQGGCHVGEQFLIAAVSKDEAGYQAARILRLDSDGNLLEESDPLPLDHANEITYNPKIGSLLVTHCQSPDGHYYRYSLVNPETFEITKTEDLEWPFFAMAYSPERDAYASAEWAGETLDYWDGELTHLRSSSVRKPGSLAQGVFCDAWGVYFVRSAQDTYGSEFRVYDWEGEFVKSVPIVWDGNIEPETLCIINGTVYVIANDWDQNCGAVYTVSFERNP
ncbi:MAG: hypothetical protein II719_02275 [Clostridia bacterium]|nr:hypothetical protein [Clostridia bacterium]